VRRGARRGLVLVAALVTAAACGGGSTPIGQGAPLGAPAEHDSPHLPVTVRSADGRPVTVRDVSRIVPLWGNLTEVVFDLGLGPNVVGRDVATTFAEAADLPVVTRGHDVSAESVLALRPTLVLANADTGPPEALDQIRSVGVPVLVLENPQRVEDVEARIHAIATALGEPAAGERIAARARAEIAEVQAGIPERAKRPKVAFLYVRGQAGVHLIAGPGSGADSMIAAAGGIDAGTAIGLTRSFTPITSEALVRAAPDALLLTTTGLESVGGIDGLLELPGVAQTPAGRARRIVTVEDGLLYSFGSRTPEALRQLIEQLYGDHGRR
jgi:iron complex transport system substrate-binding protein